MRYTASLVAVLLVACTGDDGDDKVNPPPNPTSCGIAGTTMSTECEGLSDCGRGSGNFVQPSFCDHCPPRADSHVCDAGACKEMTLGNVDVVFVVPPEARGAKSFTITAFNPIMADGGTLTCAALTSSCAFVGNEKLNAGNSRATPFPGGSADPANVYTSQIGADVGLQRVVFVQATTELQGKGAVVARGCLENVEVKEIEILRVPLDLTAI